MKRHCSHFHEFSKSFRTCEIDGENLECKQVGCGFVARRT